MSTMKAKSRTMQVHIRWMIRRDMPEVLDIENESFDFPWLEEDFIRCLRETNCIGMVAEHDDRDVGFMVYELYEHRIDLVNFAVASSFRRQGVGSQMLANLVGKLSPNRRQRIVAKVAEGRLDGQLFFRNLGFVATGVERASCDVTDEDAYVMRYEVNAFGEEMRG